MKVYSLNILKTYTVTLPLMVDMKSQAGAFYIHADITGMVILRLLSVVTLFITAFAMFL